jgi:epoxide hydrolase 4
MRVPELKRARALDCNGIRMHYVEMGSGLPVIFLHGFPDFSYSWRHQFATLSQLGFRCIAPDLRGYNKTDKPPRVADYRIAELVADVADFIRITTEGSVFLVGHDWGGIIAWRLAMDHPEVVRKLVILNAPHPARYRSLLKGITQPLRSWYAAAFQIPLLPELVLSSLHFRLLTSAAARSEAEREVYEEALSQPGALRSALNYYRAAFRDMIRGRSTASIKRIKTPTLVLWGEKDRALSPKLLDHLEEYVDSLIIVRFRDIGHWLHIDAPDRVNEELLRFLKR